MGVISWAILGLVAGCIGSKIIVRRDKGFPLNVTLGIAGAVIGGVLFDLFGASGVTVLNFWRTIAAIAGSRTLCC